MTSHLNHPNFAIRRPDPNAASDEALTEILRVAGIPLSLDPSVDELQQAILLHRRRRRVELVQFLGRMVAHDISVSPNAPQGE